MTAADFRPGPWLRHPHVQTMLGAWLRERFRLKTERIFLPSPHGDRLSVDWVEEVRPGLPAALVLHGIGGTARAAQVVSLMRTLREQLGCRVAALNFRGADGRYQLPRLYHGGSSEDLAAVVEALSRLWRRPLWVVGLSLGANILLKYLGESGADERVAAACSVGSPLDLGACGRQLETTAVTRFYRDMMLRVLKRRVAVLSQCFPSLLEPRQVMRARSFADFDSAFTAPVHGFASLQDYYRKSSSLGFLTGIRRPTLILSALDDPFLGPGVHPDPETVANPWLKWNTPQNGGHLGFFGLKGTRADYWLEACVARFFSAEIR